MRSIAPLILLVSACSTEDASPRCTFGDSGAPALLEVVHLDADLNVVTTAADAVLPLRVSPTGSWTVLIGARVTNIDSCQMNLTVSFRDACDTAVLRLDSRPTQTLIDQGDGWGLTPIADFSSLQMCPSYSPRRNLNDESFVFTVTVDDTDGKQASQEFRLSTECPADDPRCACECDKDFVLSGGCPPASGPPDEPAC